jgi:hypothetical protein
MCLGVTFSVIDVFNRVGNEGGILFQRFLDVREPSACGKKQTSYIDLHEIYFYFIHRRQFCTCYQSLPHCERNTYLRRLLVTANVVPSSQILVTLMMVALSSSETSVLTRATLRNIPEDGIFLLNLVHSVELLEI